MAEYFHRFFGGEKPPKMVHFRTTDKGNEPPLAIGYSQPMLAIRSNETTRSGIILPDVADVIIAQSTRTDVESRLPGMQDTPCDNLKEFVQKGTGIWKEVIKGVGGLTRMDLHLEERHAPAESLHDTELPVTPSAETEFRAYVAHPDEITAMEAIVASIAVQNPHGDPPPTGLYV